MAEKNIGNLIINKDGKPSTILTEREILTYLIKEGKIPDIQVKDIPSKPFVTVYPHDTVIKAAQIMIEKKKRLLVFDKGKLVGIITASDMLRGLRTTGGNPALDDVISKKVIECTYYDSIFKAIKLMYKKKIGSIIITKNNLPYGIFTERDLLTRVLTKGIDLQNRLEKYSTISLITAKLGIKGNDAAEIMNIHKIKRLALIDGEAVMAIVTARDIVDAYRRL
jgi:CBS domain-containing protein